MANLETSIPGLTVRSSKAGYYETGICCARLPGDFRGLGIRRLHCLADLACHLVIAALEVTISRGGRRRESMPSVRKQIWSRAASLSRILILQ